MSDMIYTIWYVRYQVLGIRC